MYLNRFAHYTIRLPKMHVAVETPGRKNKNPTYTSDLSSLRRQGPRFPNRKPVVSIVEPIEGSEVEGFLPPLGRKGFRPAATNDFASIRRVECPAAVDFKLGLKRYSHISSLCRWYLPHTPGPAFYFSIAWLPARM